MCQKDQIIEKNNKNEKNGTEKPLGSIFRDTALRNIGYLGHLGWICRPFVPYHITSMATVAYVCADTFIRTSASAARGDPEIEVLKTAGDAILWHFLASFALPGIFLHGVSSVTCQLQSSRSKCRPRSRFPLLPCALSALIIPFISYPIDRTVDEFMDKYIRKSGNKENVLQLGGERKDDNCEPNTTSNNNNKWFYDQSKDQLSLELDRYYQTIKNDRGGEPSAGNSGNNKDGLQTKAIQVDRNDRPPKLPKP